jgi:hypothetical protein
MRDTGTACAQPADLVSSAASDRAAFDGNFFAHVKAALRLRRRSCACTAR